MCTNYVLCFSTNYTKICLEKMQLKKQYSKQIKKYNCNKERSQNEREKL